LTKTDNFKGLTAKDIMTENPKKISNNAMAVEAIDIMDKYGITQLLCEDNDRYCGIVHIHNLTKEGII
ncbi:MAG: CBS domain-containing protein, partial [Bacteroidetes bacterium]|nr:CBS domain-containing protein [Bacteroidota bacterium]